MEFMKEIMCPQKEELFKRVVNRLIIKSCDLQSIGLIHGKMGLVIFFFHFSSFTKNPIYGQYAEQLLDEIFEDIHDQLPVDFENGYMGIGWGFEYLSQNNFIEGDTNEILESLDKKIMEWNIKRVTDLSLKRGVAGVFHYVLCRLKNKSSVSPFDNEFLSDLDKVVERWYSQCDTSLKELFKDYKSWRKNNVSFYNQQTLLRRIVNMNPMSQNDISKWNLGIEEGCAGYGLSRVL